MKLLLHEFYNNQSIIWAHKYWWWAVVLMKSPINPRFRSSLKLTFWIISDSFCLMQSLKQSLFWFIYIKKEKTWHVIRLIWFSLQYGGDGVKRVHNTQSKIAGRFVYSTSQFGKQIVLVNTCCYILNIPFDFQNTECCGWVLDSLNWIMDLLFLKDSYWEKQMFTRSVWPDLFGQLTRQSCLQISVHNVSLHALKVRSSLCPLLKMPSAHWIIIRLFNIILYLSEESLWLNERSVDHELHSAQIQTMSPNKWDMSLAKDNDCILTKNWLS